MTDAPLLSLCLATYNRARYLDRYLTHHLNALETSGIDYELVVSDNASTDETPEILARYAAKHPRMRVSRQPRNMGAYPNILTTMHLARGEVIVSISDDDLAVPEALFAYVRRMADDPSMVMVQAPWLLTDETKDGAVIGQFYQLNGEHRFERGAYADALAFVLEHHVFPECFVLRRSALASIAGPTPRFTYSYFCMLAHALSKGDVLFCPEPHVAATAVSKEAHVGNREAMESWDVYRGGLEYLASFARQTNPGGLPDTLAMGWSIHRFVSERMVVAAKLQAHARQWGETYQLLRRLHAYGFRPDIGVEPNEVAVLAAIEAALIECAHRAADEVVVGDSVPDEVLDRIRAPEGVGLVRAGAQFSKAKRAWCAVGPVDAALREGDFAVDIIPVMERFPPFG